MSNQVLHTSNPANLQGRQFSKPVVMLTLPPRFLGTLFRCQESLSRFELDRTVVLMGEALGRVPDFGLLSGKPHQADLSLRECFIKLSNHGEKCSSIHRLSSPEMNPVTALSAAKAASYTRNLDQSRKRNEFTCL